MIKNLVIVESPAKAKTIEKFLGKDFTVRSCFGHIRDLNSKKLSVDVENNFAPDYEIPADKKKVVSELKKMAKEAETVWLASDEDREGEAISWHLFEALGLKQEKTKRIVFHEITKDAIQKAIEKPRGIDMNLVDAQQARRVLDRLVGYEVSPILWKKVKPSLSAGRVQSVAVKLIVEREKEITNFKSESSYKVTGFFKTEKGEVVKAELNTKFSTLEQANAFLKKCSEAKYEVASVETKPTTKSPAAPFTTSTLQQEAGRKLGYSVSKTMTLAQRLYEAGHITYMRTDSVNLSDLAINTAKQEIINLYGKEFSEPRNYTSKSKNAQEAHEAIRPTYIANKSIDVESGQERLYDLIWKRTVASQMSKAELEKTTLHIELSNTSEKFIATGEVIKFEGFLKVYLESTDDEQEDADSGLLPATKKGDLLNYNSIQAVERFTHYPARYTEASLVRKMEDLGIGRPSTYAPTISTIQKRGYVVLEDREGVERKYNSIELKAGNIEKEEKVEMAGRERKKLFPTDIGIVVSDFLDEYFKRIMDYGFTAKVEEQFDEIANGQLKWNKMIEQFYNPFHKNVENTTENAERATGERELGTDPETGKPVIVRIGKFGPMAQIGKTEDEGGAKFASLLSSQAINTITLEEALELFKFPKTVGKYEGHEVIVSQGRFGPYVKFDDLFISIPKNEDISSVDLKRAIELIKQKLDADAPIDEYEGMPVQKGVGRFGPFIKWNGMFINVSKKYDFDNLSHNDIVQLIEDKKKKEKEKYIHRWDDEGISVQKARWGRFHIVKGKQKIELPKTFDVEKLTLDEVKKMLEENAPKKKAAAKRKK